MKKGFKFLALLITVCLMIGCTANASGFGTYYTNTDVLFKTDDGHKYMSVPIAKGTKVESLSIGEDWTKVTINGQEGFVRTQFIQRNKPQSAWVKVHEKAVVCSETKVFTWYYGKTKVIKIVQPGKRLTVTGVNERSKYVRIKFGSNIAYVLERDIRFERR